MRPYDRSSSEKLFWPVVWAVGLHAMLFAFLFVSFSNTPELPPARPVIKATLYQLQSQSQATTQTNQKIAGEAAKTSAQRYEVEQLAQKKIEQERLAALAQKAAQAQSAAETRAAQARKQAEEKAAQAQKQAAQAQKQAQAKKEDQAKQAAEKLKQAEVAKIKAAEDAKKKAAEDAKKKAAEDAKKKAAEDAKKKAAEDAKKKAAEDAKKKANADAAKKKAAADAAAKQKAEADKKKQAAEAADKQRKAQEAARKAMEDKKAGALAELLSNDTQYQQTKADTVGSQVAGNLDDLIVRLVSEQWVRPPSARNGMAVTVLIEMLPDGTITNASVTRSSGDPAFDASAVAAVRNVGRVREMQQLDRKTFDSLYRKRSAVFKPEDLGL
ncbi:MAG TPA: cell envelope integrity protein TolA [Thiopseudomonas sp.]|nr:cell envelope integrity protein TolA [Thiopseudomonas sp.]